MPMIDRGSFVGGAACAAWTLAAAAQDAPIDAA
jgi:hypothetical protein